MCGIGSRLEIYLLLFSLLLSPFLYDIEMEEEYSIFAHRMVHCAICFLAIGQYDIV